MLLQIPQAKSFGKNTFNYTGILAWNFQKDKKSFGLELGEGGSESEFIEKLLVILFSTNRNVNGQ
jgi:hypothetical protein